VPHLSVDPGHAGDETIGFDGALDGAGGGIDLVDLAVAMIPHPQAAFGPGHPRVAALAGRRDRGDHFAGGGIDLVDARLRDLIKVLAVECRTRVASDVEGIDGIAAVWIEGHQFRARSGPDTPAVMRDASDLFDAGKSVLAH